MGSSLEIVRAALTAFEAGDMDGALEYADSEVISYRAPPLPDAQTYHGHEGVLQMYADWTADFDEFEMHSVDYAELGDQVVVEMVQRGTGRASGVEVSGRFWFVLWVADGKIERFDAYSTREQALAVARS